MSTPNMNLPVGETVFLKHILLDQNNNPMNVQNPAVGANNPGPGNPQSPTWTSDTPSVAKVNTQPGTGKGLVTGVSPGVATLTVSFTDAIGNTATGQLQVTVYAQVATSIQIVFPAQ